MVFAWPSISALALLYVIGAYAVALGILAVAASFRLPLDRQRHRVDGPDRASRRSSSGS